MAERNIATLAGGCFWCLEAVYKDLIGIDSVVSGYMGGQVDNPTYRQVCNGDTGHAEVVQITYDPAVITYDQLLDVFFTIHDPTQLNRQGNDIGTQYRSAIYVHSPEQETADHGQCSAARERERYGRDVDRDEPGERQRVAVVDEFGQPITVGGQPFQGEIVDPALLDRQCGAGAFSKPHAERQERGFAQPFDSHDMTGGHEPVVAFG